MKSYTLKTRHELLELNEPIVMSILNVTPDSFAISCASMQDEDILRCAETAVSEGARILDIGGYSTRSGAAEVSTEEEWQRVEKALRVIRQHMPETILSVDTFRAEVARRACQYYDADIINDVSGGELDSDMFATVAEQRAAYVLMHMRGTPNTMQSMCQYQHMMAEITDYFARKVDQLRQSGVSDIVLDPGFGFAKTTAQNYELLSHMDELKQLGLPILAGLSRKSMIYKVLDCVPTSDSALHGTIALNMIALQKGANILRVHDTRACAQTIEIYKQL